MLVYSLLTMTNQAQLSELMTVKEVATMLGVSDRRVRYMITEQKLEARKLGDGNLPYLVVRSSVLEFMQQQKERDHSDK